MSTFFQIRKVRDDEVEAASLLAIRVFEEFVAPSCSLEGRGEFANYASPHALRKRHEANHITFVAEAEGQMVGMLHLNLGMTSAIEERYQAHWLAQVRAKGCTEADLAVALERMKADRTATLEDQLAWLRSSGFIQADCWYKNYRFAVYSGQKPRLKPCPRFPVVTNEHAKYDNPENQRLSRPCNLKPL